MKVKLKQHYQDARIHLEPGQVYDGELVPYLLYHRMAEEVKEAPAKEPAPVSLVGEPPAEPEPQAFEKPKRSRRAQ